MPHDEANVMPILFAPWVSAPVQARGQVLKIFYNLLNVLSKITHYVE